MSGLQGAQRMLFEDFRRLGFTVDEATRAATDERVFEESFDVLLSLTFDRTRQREADARLTKIGRRVAPAAPKSISAEDLSEARVQVAIAGAFGGRPPAWATEALRAPASTGRRLLESARSAVVPSLREAGAATAVGGRFRVKIIAPGRGSCGYYSAEMLKRDGPRVFTAGLQSFLDHPTQSERYERPERSVRDLAGRLATSAVWEDSGPLGAGLYADIEVFPQFRDLLVSVASSIGVSIRAYGEASEQKLPDGTYGPMITTLSGAESVDFVTAAGAGGAIVSSR